MQAQHSEIRTLQLRMKQFRAEQRALRQRLETEKQRHDRLVVELAFAVEETDGDAVARLELELHDTAKRIATLIDETAVALSEGNSLSERLTQATDSMRTNAPLNAPSLSMEAT